MIYQFYVLQNELKNECPIIRGRSENKESLPKLKRQLPTKIKEYPRLAYS